MCNHVQQYKNTKKEKNAQKLKRKAQSETYMQPCSITRPPRKKAFTKTQKESSKREHACNHVQQQNRQERNHAQKHKRKAQR